MKQIIAMHGWYSDSTYWKDWEDHFQSNGWLWKNSERGYGYIVESEPYWEESAKGKIPQQKVIFCHSLGIHLVSRKLLKEATAIVLLNSFSRFIPNGKESRSTRIALHGMQKHLGKQTEGAMLLKFIEKANHPYIALCSPQQNSKKEISAKGREKLKTDLDLLINSKELPDGLKKQAKVLVIHGQKDQIVSAETKQSLIDDLTKHLATPPLSWEIKEEGHFIRSKSLINKVHDWLSI